MRSGLSSHSGVIWLTCRRMAATQTGSSSWPVMPVAPMGKSARDFRGGARGAVGVWAVIGMCGVLGGFLNNTPVVVLAAPVIRDVAQSLRLSPKRFLMPLSHVSVLGGLMTLIGTSTNLLVNDMARNAGQQVFTLFEITPVGLVIAAVGGLWLWTGEGPHFVDLDDCLSGPAVQDLWMLAGRREDSAAPLRWLLEGYEQFRHFDRRELHLVEPLRTLRLLHYNAWIARRWHDPAFPAAFPWFEAPRHWESVITQMQEQLSALQEPPPDPT